MASFAILVTPPARQSIIILGAGPAGLSAAQKLTQKGYRVSVVDQSPRLGERSGREGDPPFSILGCHQATWSLLRSLGHPSDSTAFAEASLDFMLPGGRVARYPRTRFPTPLQQLFTIGRFAGLSWKERWKLLSWLEEIWEGSAQLAVDLEHRTAENWLESLHLDRALIHTVWNPLAHWLTGNNLQQLSADAFIASIKPFFLSRASDSRLYVPLLPWQQIFAGPLTQQLSQSDATLYLGLQAVRFEFQEEHVTGIRCRDGTVLRADWYISAVPHHQLTPLLPERWLTRYAYFQQTAELTSAPLIIIQARTTQEIASPRHVLIGDGPFAWIACKPSRSSRGTVVVTSLPLQQTAIEVEPQFCRMLESLHVLESKDQLTDFSQEEVPHAALTLPPGTKTRRPIQLSPISNLLVAGAWTDTGWPANFESAIVSGERCAEIIIDYRKT